MGITHLQVVSIPVSDQDRARDFYRDVLGFEVEADNPMGPDQRWVELRPKGAQTSITLVTWFDSMPAGSLKGLVLDTDDVRTDYEALRARGLRFTDELKDDFWGVWAGFEDPDGNGWALAQAKEMPQR